MTALCRRVWRAFFRFLWRVHCFNFWDWVRDQAYPPQQAAPWTFASDHAENLKFGSDDPRYNRYAQTDRFVEP